MTRLEKCQLAVERGFRYDPETGIIYGVKGKEITRRDKGYVVLQIRSGGKQYVLKGHHYAWYVINGDTVLSIDHKNRKTDDNRISNLRSSTHAEQTYNTKAKGYCWNKIAKKWVSELQVNGKKVYLGHYEKEEDARNAYLEGKKIHHIIK